MADKALASITEALAASSPLVVGVVKDDVLIDGISSMHPAIRGRVGPNLHERGVMVLRILRGVTSEELAALVEILQLSPQAVFERGGVTRLAVDAGLARVQLDELAHDVTAEERDAQRRRTRLRSLFKEVLLDLLGRRVVDARTAEQLVELLEHPEIAVAVLEAEPAGLAEAAAGLALMARQEEKQSGLPLADKVRTVLLALSPRARDRVLVGLPTLVDEFRAALKWAFDGLSDREVATMVAPSLRAHANDLDVTLYALSAAVPGTGRRLSALYWVGGQFFDWPADDSGCTEALATLARPVDEHVSFYSERTALRSAAERALAASERLAGILPPVSPNGAPYASEPPSPPPGFDGRQSVAEVIRIATRTRSFEAFCEGLPVAAGTLLADGSNAGVLGILSGLALVPADAREAAAKAAARVAEQSAPGLLDHFEAESARPESGALGDDIGPVVRVIAEAAPGAVLDRLDTSTNRRMRRILLDALSRRGGSLVGLVRPRLADPRWYVVRNAVVLVGRSGGDVGDLASAHDHPDERVRLEVVRALRVMPPSSDGMTLAVRMLADPSAEVSRGAGLLLRGDLLDADTIAELERVIADDARLDDVRLAGIEALGRSTRDEAAEALFQLMHPVGLIESSAAGHVRDQAALALHGCPAQAAGERFARGLASSVRRVRRACERAVEARR
jgi:hypothetical protein